MDYESYLAEEHTPLVAIQLLSDIIYEKCNEDWDMFFYNKQSKEDREELLALNYVIKLCAEKLLERSLKEVKNIAFW